MFFRFRFLLINKNFIYHFSYASRHSLAASPAATNTTPPTFHADLLPPSDALPGWIFPAYFGIIIIRWFDRSATWPQLASISLPESFAIDMLISPDLIVFYGHLIIFPHRFIYAEIIGNAHTRLRDIAAAATPLSLAWLLHTIARRVSHWRIDDDKSHIMSRYFKSFSERGAQGDDRSMSPRCLIIPFSPYAT